jgi:hypothetical protein
MMERRIHLIGSFATDWIRYSDYEYKTDSEVNLYIKPKENAAFSMYNPSIPQRPFYLIFLRLAML